MMRYNMRMFNVPSKNYHNRQATAVIACLQPMGRGHITKMSAGL